MRGGTAYQGDMVDSMVGVGAGVAIGILTEGALERGAHITSAWPTRMVLLFNPFRFFIEDTLTPQLRAILTRVSPRRTV